MGKCCAVIVTFHPNAKHLETMVSILKSQVEYIVIVDNTDNVDALLKSDGKVHYIHLGENHGIATAQNIGLKKAIEFGCVGCIIFDQDSIISENMCPQLVNDLSILLNEKINVAAIGPRIFDVLENKIEGSSKEIELINNCFETKQIIASGTLFNLEYISTIGMMEDDLFIDGVDHEWCWRAINQGFKICISNNILMEHVIGIDRGRVFNVEYIISAPIRHYYQFRNILLLLPRTYVPRKWKIKKTLEIFLLPIIFCLKGPDRKKRLKYMMYGVLDGIRGLAGKIR